MNNYVIYICDTETTGLDYIKNDVIELSLIRLSDNVQKTWCLKPFNFETIELGALKVNGHKLEDITHQTKIGRETYLDPKQVIVDVENWIMEDNLQAENRIFCGHNARFDLNMLEQLWSKCDSRDSLPFGRRMMDTMIIEFMMDYCKEDLAEGYSLNNLVKKYGVHNNKAHSAASDTLAAKEVFVKQVEALKKILKK